MNFNNYILRKVSSSQIIPENIFLYTNPHSISPSLRSIEINPIEYCNHNCPWCFTRPFREHEKASILHLSEYLKTFKKNGGVSVHFSGGGEPLLFKPFRIQYKEFDNLTLLEFTNKLQLATGLITNGLLLDELPPVSYLNYLAFIRISLDATDATTHAKRHGCPIGDFSRIIKSVANLLKIRGKAVTPAIGLSFIIDPNNNQFTEVKEILALKKLITVLKVDFVQLKHIHTSNPTLADKTMKAVFDITRSIEWNDTEVWVHRYLPAEPSQICKITKFIEVIDAKQRSFPCCHVNGQNKYMRFVDNFGSKEIINCDSKVCRYRSMNDLLNENDHAMGLQILEENLEKTGFHPHRLFPSAPELFK
jgi:sulfatase maturation enzyme AslB (radical SAM superfamily)